MLDRASRTKHYSEHLFTEMREMNSTTSRATATFRHRLMDAMHPLSDADAWNRILNRINPMWSTTGVRARVVARVEETSDTFSLWLKPNGRWRGHHAGQHVELGVDIDGVRRRRVFSVSNAGGSQAPLRITIQRQGPDGVTAWLHANARPGLIVDIGQAGGEFVLPSPLPDALLMIAGGSGITPLLAMLHALADRACTADIVLLQLFRHPDQRLFAEELAALSKKLPGLRTLTHCSAENGRLSAADIASRVPDLSRRHALLCGPEGLMTQISQAWDRLGLPERLQIERFGAPRPATGTGSAVIHASESEQVFTQDAELTLLESAEAAGLAPRFGCRAGLCRTCLCRKRSGEARNLITGLVSSQPDEWIQLCVSVAESDLELAL